MTQLNEYQQRAFDNATVLAEELSKYYPTTATIQEDVTTGPLIILVRNGKKYQVRKQWKGEIDFFAFPHNCHNSLDFSTRSDVYKKYATNNMRVLSQKKIDAKLDAIDQAEQELADLESQAATKKADFLAKIASSGLPVEYTHESSYEFVDGENKRIEGEIDGGYIDKGNLRFSFKFHNDGYISEDISIIKTYQLGLEGFAAMADNKYKDN